MPAISPFSSANATPPGIVFYPRYFEMLNATVEAFFAEGLGYSFARIHIAEGLRRADRASRRRFPCAVTTAVRFCGSTCASPASAHRARVSKPV